MPVTLCLGGGDSGLAGEHARSGMVYGGRTGDVFGEIEERRPGRAGVSGRHDSKGDHQSQDYRPSSLACGQGRGAHRQLPLDGDLARGGSQEIKHGAIIVATGATEQKPNTYGYGQSPKVLTQLELTDRLGRGEISLPERPTIAMIQCVEQRTRPRPIAAASAARPPSRMPWRAATYPQARIVVLYRDMRTYGFREAAYREARRQGVLFVRYEPERPPQLEIEWPAATAGPRAVARPHVGARSRTWWCWPRRWYRGPTAASCPRLLRVPLNADGFFLEAHMKLRPVDFASEGLFLCGTAHAPKFISETISQANAVAGRAASILGRKKMPVGGQIAWVDPDKCISCMTCVHVCPYMAPQIDENNKAEVQGAMCMGCGSCTAECPAKAITLRHFVDAQILAAVNSLLCSRCEAERRRSWPIRNRSAWPRRVGQGLPASSEVGRGPRTDMAPSDDGIRTADPGLLLPLLCLRGSRPGRLDATCSIRSNVRCCGCRARARSK